MMVVRGSIRGVGNRDLANGSITRGLSRRCLAIWCPINLPLRVGRASMYMAEHHVSAGKGCNGKYSCLFNEHWTVVLYVVAIVHMILRNWKPFTDGCGDMDCVWLNSVHHNNQIDAECYWNAHSSPQSGNPHTSDSRQPISMRHLLESVWSHVSDQLSATWIGSGYLWRSHKNYVRLWRVLCKDIWSHITGASLKGSPTKLQPLVPYNLTLIVEAFRMIRNEKEIRPTLQI